jgi:hypothetical protein
VIGTSIEKTVEKWNAIEHISCDINYNFFEKFVMIIMVIIAAVLKKLATW